MSEDEKFRWAIQNGEISSVKKQLEQGASLNGTKDGKSRPPLLIAADFGQTDVIQLLLEEGADVNVKDQYEITPLLAAIYEEHEECVKLLLAKGASRDGKTQNGETYYEVASDSMKKLLKN